VQRFLAWIECENFSSSTNNETALPGPFVLTSVLSEWQAKQSELSMARRALRGPQTQCQQQATLPAIVHRCITVLPAQQEVHAKVGETTEANR
jgi:hypothetical protein